MGSHESSSGLSKPSSPTAPRDFSSTALRFCRYLSSSFPNSCRACCSIARSSGAGPCCLPPSSSDHESLETTRVALRTGRAAMQKGRQGAVCTVAEYLPQPLTAQQARPSAPPKVFAWVAQRERSHRLGQPRGDGMAESVDDEQRRHRLGLPCSGHRSRDNRPQQRRKNCPQQLCLTTVPAQRELLHLHG